MVTKLRKNNQVLCTSRRYGEVDSLARIQNFKLKLVGSHGGGTNFGKVQASTSRIKQLLPVIKKFSPNLVISCTSPEASRISFGLGIKHIAFSDSPHAESVMKLSIPLIQKLLIPWIIPKKEFVRFGIRERDIIRYRAIDAASISKRKISKKNISIFDPNKKTILVRIEENKASYIKKKSRTISIIKELQNEFVGENIVVIARYKDQRSNLKKILGNKIKILGMEYDGKILLENTDVFIGSGGTMTAESALLGVPTISYNAVPNLIEKYLVKSKLVKREMLPKKIVECTKRILLSKKDKTRAKRFVSEMEDPYAVLRRVMKYI